MPGPGVQLGSLYPSTENTALGMDGGGGDGRNPLVCCLCDDYFTDPCLLQCYHTFCAKCLRGREVESRISCPICGNLTVLKDNSSTPPADVLMKQLIDLVNAENPPCANCDKRDKNSMYFCSTCGQALCTPCRENTHRAKMFSLHEVVHMSKCASESQKRCPIHGEQYIMFNNAQKTMLCMTCFRDTPTETRIHCVDMETAYLQCGKKLDRAVVAVCEVQNSVREGLLMVKTLLEELRRNMDCEKHTINTFCQGMQDAIAKTHSTMIMEVQRQYEIKERTFRSQFISLGTMLPVIQLHLLMCHNFTSIANKYQFVDLALSMIERLSAITQLNQPQRPVQNSQIRTNYRNEFSQALDPFVGKSGHTAIPTEAFESNISLNHPPPSKRQQNALRVKAMEGEGPFSNHCRSFDNQVKELNQQLVMVKDRFGDLHRDVTFIRRAQTPPLLTRYQHITGDCAMLEEQLERHQVELERMKIIFETLWEEQICRIHVEQEIFHAQMNEIFNLRGELKHLSNAAQQLEPYVKTLAASLQQIPQKPSDAIKHAENQQVQELNLHSQQLQAILEHINKLQLESQKLHKVTSPLDAVTKDCKEGRSRPRTPSQPGVTAMLDPSGNVILYESAQRGQASSGRGVISQLMDKVRTKEDRKKSPEDRERVSVPSRERSKSDGRAEIIRAKAALEGLQDKQPQSVAVGKSKRRDSKVASIYQSISGRVLGTKTDESDARLQGRLPPPPPPARRGPMQDPNSDIRERLEAHLKEKLHEMMRRGSISKHGRPEKSLSLDAQTMEEYQRMSEVIMDGGDERKTRGLHREHSSKSASTATSPRRREHRERSRERKDRERSWERTGERSRDRQSDGSRERKRERSRDRQSDRSRERRESHDRDRSRDRRDHRDRSREHRAGNRDLSNGREKSKERRKDKYGRCYPASDTEEAILYRGQISRKQNSCDSLTMSTVSVDSRKSSQTDLGDRKTLVLVIGGGKGSKQKNANKQRSWETFPPKKKTSSSSVIDSDHYGRGRQDSQQDVRPASAQDGRRGYDLEPEGTLRKVDSFEGHEEAVRTLVAAVHQTRSQLSRKKSGGNVSN